MNSKIFRNSTYLIFAQGLVKIIAFFYTIFLASNLGVDSFGVFTVALAYFSLVSIIADFGFNRYLIREGALDQQVLPKITCSMTLMRLCLTSVLFALFALWLYLFDGDGLRVGLSTLAILAVVPQSIGITIDAALAAKEKFGISAIGALMVSLVTALTGVYLINNGQSVLGAVSALIIGQVAYALIMVVLAIRTKIRLIHIFDSKDVKDIIKGSLPYGVLGVLGLLYFRVDTLILSYLKGSYDTGIYGVAYKFLEAIIFVPSSIALALFPTFAKLSQEHPAMLRRLYSKALGVNLLMSVGVVLGYLFVLPLLINQFLPQYQKSLDVIRILTITIPFMFMISTQSIVLFSQERFLKPLIYMSLFNLVLNIVLNFIFVPKYSYIASAWITVFSDIVGFLIFYIFIKLQLPRKSFQV